MMRLIHLIVVAALVAAAGDVYKIKFESTLQAERVAKLGAEIKRERDAIAHIIESIESDLPTGGTAAPATAPPRVPR